MNTINNWIFKSLSIFFLVKGSAMAHDHQQAHFQIIYLNGPSSSGKSTLAKALQNTLEEPFLHIGIDKIIGMMPSKLNNWEGDPAPLGFSWKLTEDSLGHPVYEIQSGPFAKKICKTFKEIVLTMAKEGHFIIIDDIAFGKNQVDEWREYLKDFKVLWVGLKPSLSVIEEREKQRGDRMLGSARHQFYTTHDEVNYDLEIDSSNITEECVAKIVTYFKHELTKNSYDSTAFEYAKNVSTFHNKEVADIFLKFLSLKAKILDLGCGPGRDAKIFSDIGLQVTGIDFSPQMIEIAKKTAPHAQFYTMNIESIELPLESFDGVYASASLLHIPKKNLPNVLEKIRSLLKKEGIFYLSIKKGKGELIEEDVRYNHVKKFWSFFEEDEIQNYLEQAGFEIIELFITEKKNSYQTHAFIHVFCKK